MPFYIADDMKQGENSIEVLTAMNSIPLLVAAAIVFFTFFFDVLILWILKIIGGTPKAEVKANVKRFGGNLAISGAGLIGSFLAIAVLAFVAIYLIARLASL